MKVLSNYIKQKEKEKTINIKIANYINKII